MLKETLTSLLSVCNEIEINGQTGLAKSSYASKQVKRDMPRSMSSTMTPQIIITQIGLPIPHNKLNRPGDYEIDSTSGENIIVVKQPECYNIMYQIDGLTFNEHHHLEFIEEINTKIGMAKDITVSFNIGGYAVEEISHMHRMNEQDLTRHENEFQGRAAYTYIVNAWSWVEKTPRTVPELEQVVVRRAEPGSDKVDLEVTYDV